MSLETWTRTHTARREHQCDACGEAVARGERYEYTRTLYDGTWHTGRWHLDCLRLCEHIQRQDGTDEEEPGAWDVCHLLSGEPASEIRRMCEAAGVDAEQFLRLMRMEVAA